jgi:hypothetical protein
MKGVTGTAKTWKERDAERQERMRIWRVRHGVTMNQRQDERVRKA